MCGLSAIVGLADGGQDGHVVQGQNQDSLTREMEDSLQLIKHRGPDSRGIWVSPDQRIGSTSSPPYSATRVANAGSPWP